MQLHAQQLAAGDPAGQRTRLTQLCAGLGVTDADLAPHRATLALLYDLNCFPQ